MNVGRLRLREIGPPTALAVFVLAAYWRFTGLYFQGGDTWPHIWTTRIDGVGALVGVLTRPIMNGTVFPDTVALFFRPLSSLSYSFNYAVWGMNPFAFHVTDVVIHTSTSILLYLLMTSLGLRRWAAAIGAGTFAIHPAMAAVVPSLPRRHDSLAVLGVVSALVVAVPLVRERRPARATWTGLAIAAAFLGLAELSKESAYIGLALVPPTLLLAARSATCSWRARCGRIGMVLTAFAVISGLMFAWRWVVLGGIGGYYERTPPLANLDVALSDLLQNLLFPWYSLLGRTLRAWLTEIGLLVLFTGVPMLVVGRRAGAIIAYGWAWLVVCAAFQLASKSLAAWHSYITIAGFAFLVGGVLDGCVQALASRTRHVLVKVTAAAGLIGLAIFDSGIVGSSVVLRPFEEWRIAGEITRSYLFSLRPCLERAPPGVRVEVANAPDALETTTPERILIHAGMLGPYSVKPAVDLLMPDIAPRELEARALSQPTALPSDISTRCALDRDVWLITTNYIP